MTSARAFVVIGGAEIGAGSVRQLLRAREAGRLPLGRIVVVDRDPGCRATSFGAPVHVEASDWTPWLDAHLDDFGPDDHLVPYHWAPHLLRDWLSRQLVARGATVAAAPTLAPRGLPYEATTGAGDRALSYATWVCPPTCIEPALCPHTRGPKDWSLAADLERGRGGEAIDDRVVFRCLHFAYGVGTIPIRDIQGARDRLVGGLGGGTRRYLVATSSHCHALAAGIEVSPGSTAL